MFFTENLFTRIIASNWSLSDISKAAVEQLKVENLTLVHIYPHLHLLLIKALNIKITSFLSVEEIFQKILKRNLELSENFGKLSSGLV